MNRKSFLLQSALGTVSIIGGVSLLGFSKNPLQKPDKGAPLESALVKEFVGAAHKDFEKVKTMLEETPALLNSVNNLGGWDWEDALGAAGHVGLPETANYLLEKGARMTICVAAMLGKIEIIKSHINAFPYMKDSVGPHNISLMRHAKAGGENSLEVLEYLKSIGAKE